MSEDAAFWTTLSEEEWRQRLGPERYRICRQHGTEPPGSGCWLAEKRSGIYCCAGCALPLFRSDCKYDSGSGWPSFFAPLTGAALEQRADSSHGMERIEVRCGRCHSHLGHLFADGPAPTGLRYCINALSLEFLPD